MVQLALLIMIFEGRSEPYLHQGQYIFFFRSNDSLVIGKKNKLRVEVSNSGEPVYVPTLIVTADPGITLTPISQGLRDCANYNETSLSCIIDKSIKNDNKVRLKANSLHLICRKEFD